MLYLVSYDIPDDKRRTKLAKSLKNFGDRVQYSVFECILSPELFSDMAIAIDGIIDGEQDSVRIYSICAACERQVEIVGLGEVSELKDLYVV